MKNGKHNIKCNGCKCLRGENEEHANYKENRRKTCIICKENRENLNVPMANYKKYG